MKKTNPFSLDFGAEPPNSAYGRIEFALPYFAEFVKGIFTKPLSYMVSGCLI